MARLQRRQEEELDRVALRHQVAGWWGVKFQSKIIGKQMDAGKKALLKIVQRYGEVQPETGSLFLELGEAVSDRGIVRLKAQRAETMGVNPEALERILKEKGLYDEMVEWIPQIDEGKVHAAYFDKKITDDELSRIFPRSVHYSLILLDEADRPVN